MFVYQVRHDIQGDDEDKSTQSQGIVSKWRQKERLKTTAVALVLCLNIGVDPPDVIKISPCARLECWVDPLSMQPPKALDTIGDALRHQQHAASMRYVLPDGSGNQADAPGVQAKTCKHNTRGGSLVQSTRCTWIPPWTMSRSWLCLVGEPPRCLMYFDSTIMCTC